MNGLLTLARHLRICHKEYLVYLKGGSGSGGWGHDGRQGKHGGSQAGSGGLKKIGVTSRAGISRRKKLAKKVSTTKRITRTLKPKVEKKPISKVKPAPKKKVVPEVKPVEKKPPAKPRAADIRAELVDLDKGVLSHGRKILKRQEALTTSLTDLYQRDEALTEKIEKGKISAKKADSERQAIQNGFTKAQSEVDGIEEMTANAPRFASIKKQRELLYAKEDPAKLNLKFASGMDRKELQEGFDEFAKMLGKGTVLDGKDVIIKDAKGRAHADHEGKGVSLNNDSSTRTVIHEMAHMLELSTTDVPGGVFERADRFLQKRTKGEKAQKMKDLTGNSQYNDREVTKPDKFHDPYVGSIYRDRGKTYATEIMSMGIERMWKEPARFAKDDPEYFDFIYDTLDAARTR